jgi:septum formation protein
MNKPIILASTSPRRRELLGLLGLPFTVRAVDVDETSRPGEQPDVLVARLSATKAAAAAQALLRSAAEGEGEASQDLNNSLVLAADTVVALEGEILGKPDDASHARQMLRRLRARSHTVHSGVAVVEVSTGRTAIHLNVTTVWMRDYSDAEIDAYVATGDPLDKAGAYAIQHVGFRPVMRIEGCYSGVMGLPLGAVAEGLAHFGARPPVDLAQVCQERTGHACCQA